MLIALGYGVFLALLAVGFAALAWAADYRLASESELAAHRRWLLRWSLQGLALPSLLWVLMNLGISQELQPFMPPLQAAQGTPRWFPLFCGYAGGGLAVISSYWAAVTLGWILWRAWAGLEGEMWKEFRSLCWTSLGGMVLPALFFIWLGGWTAGGFAALLIFAPIAGYAPVILRPKKMPPLYAKAIARMKFGKYAEAEAEVIKQLENREDDFEGWMMLADLYANHFNDIGEAEQTVLEICDQPRTTPTQVSIALHRLADWYLKHQEDPDAARRALGVIGNRLPGTHLARMAELRAASLPRTTEEYREQQLNKPVHLPALHDPLDDARGTPPPVDLAAARQRAAVLENRLRDAPADEAAREELARLLAVPLGQVDAALAHVDALLAQSGQPPEKCAGWLGLVATWQIEILKDRAQGSETLRQIIRQFPETPTAFAAQRRLFHFDMEEKQARARKSPPPIPRIRIEMDSGNSGKQAGG